ncbi:MAG: hypothetical protein ACLVJ6_17625 [Merdibacter sp.]
MEGARCTGDPGSDDAASARALKLSGKRGIRRGGCRHDRFQARDLEELFCSFGRQRLHRIIHQGVHIYPHVII